MKMKNKGTELSQRKAFLEVENQGPESKYDSKYEIPVNSQPGKNQ